MFMLNNSRISKLTMVLAVIITLTAIFMLPLTSSSAIAPANAGGANDFYQRHPELSLGIAPASEINSDFFERHPDWVNNVQILGVPVTGLAEASDYFQRHPEYRPLGETTDLSDYFLRH